jgi:hypothetical protein
LFEDLLARSELRSDAAARAERLTEIRNAIMAHPVDPELLQEVTDAVEERFGDARVRFRSSSNTEDLPRFNGAGLYTSVSAELDDADRAIEDAMRTVWASLWSARAYDEREFAYIDQSKVAMGILVHPAFLSERANAVVISRNVLDPIRSDIYYMNAQVGEASVVNPAPGVGTEQVLYRWGRDPRFVYNSYSSLAGQAVMSAEEIDRVMCTLSAIHYHFLPRLDPARENRWFAMDVELKLIGPDRQLLVKQARPYSFGNVEVPADCREF